MDNKNKSSLHFVSSSVSALVSIATLSILSRSLDYSEYAFYNQITMVVSVLVSISVFGIPQAIFRFVSDGDYRTKEIYKKNILCVFFFFSIFGSLAIFFGASFLSTIFVNSYFLKYRSLLAVLVFLEIMLSFFSNFFIVEGRNKYLAIFHIVPSVIYFASLLLILSFLRVEVYLLIVLLLVRFLVMISFALNDVLRIAFNQASIALSFMKEIVRFSLPLGLSTVFGLIIKYTDKMVVSILLDERSFAVFTNGAFEVPFVGMISSSLFVILTPTIVKFANQNNLASIRNIWKRAGKTLMVLLVPVTVTLIVFAKYFVVILFSDKYIDSIPVFMLYQTLLIIRIYVFSPIYIAFNKTSIYFKITLASSLINLFLDIIMVLTFGMIGAALASVISIFFGLFLSLKNISDFTGAKKLSDFFPINELLISLLASSLVSLGFYYVCELIDIFAVDIILIIISFFTCFWLLSKLISSEIVVFIKSKLPLSRRDR